MRHFPLAKIEEWRIIMREDSATYCGWNKLVLKLGNVQFVPPVDQMKEGNGKGKKRKLERIQEEERNFEEYFRSMRDLRVVTEPEETVEEQEGLGRSG